MKPVTYDKKRITSTVILGIFLAISIFFTLLFIGLTWAQLNEAMEAAKEQSQGEDVGGQIAVGGVLALTFGIVIAVAIVVYIALIINDSIFLIFSIKNRKSTLKAVRIISYVYDGLFATIIVISIIKLILFLCGL